jgi:hypothetical protein
LCAVPTRPPTTDLPPPNSGPELLRRAIHAKKQTEMHAAVALFGVGRAAMSQWLNGKFCPNSYHRQIARDEYGVSLEAWDTEAERKARLERQAAVVEEPAPPSKPRPKATSRPKAAKPSRKVPVRVALPKPLELTGT